MRCYLMRGGRIWAVEILEAGSSDASLIEQGKAQFDRRKGEGFDGFEVWDGARPLYRHHRHSAEPPKTSPD
jgi:hypothetical protein